MQAYDVFIAGVLAGQMGRTSAGQVIFKFLDAYREMTSRPVLGQRFEDDLRRQYRGEAGALPPFFANLVPEAGPLRDLLESSLGLAVPDDLALLSAVGRDLPGALEVRPNSTGLTLFDAAAVAEAESGPLPLTPASVEDDTAFRFSLAGVQMKFSVLVSSDKLLLPMHDTLGEWIVKFDSQRFPQLVENEFATMSWAKAAGFVVPDCQILSAGALPAELAGQAPAGSNIFLIRRYDREGGRRIHQEDFAQVAGLRPALKYEHWTYERCARVVLAICGPAGYDDFVRRLVFMVASGNTDGHLKNWSLLYPDGINAVLTPLYDQVSVIAWPPTEKHQRLEWALKFAGTKNLYHVDEATFERVARLSGADPRHTQQLVRNTLGQIADAWKGGTIAELYPPAHAGTLRDFWKRVPLLKQLSDFSA